MSQPVANISDTGTPKHLGLILDGNRRWAREHNVPIYEGHKAGYRNMEKILQAALDRGGFDSTVWLVGVALIADCGQLHQQTVRAPRGLVLGL